MPPYANTTPPSSIGRGDTQNVWSIADGNNFISGTKTQRVALQQTPAGGAQKLSVRIAFQTTPGVISLQPQVSDTDVDADYQSEGPPLTTIGNNFEVRAEFPAITAKFARLLATTVTTPNLTTVDFSA